MRPEAGLRPHDLHYHQRCNGGQCTGDKAKHDALHDIHGSLPSCLPLSAHSSEPRHFLLCPAVITRRRSKSQTTSSANRAEHPFLWPNYKFGPVQGTFLGANDPKSAPGRRTIGPNWGFGHNLATALTDFGAAVGGRFGRGPRQFPKLTFSPIAIGEVFSASG